jgi:hypothetical protein
MPTQMNFIGRQDHPALLAAIAGSEKSVGTTMEPYSENATENALQPHIRVGASPADAGLPESFPGLAGTTGVHEPLSVG